MNAGLCCYQFARKLQPTLFRVLVGQPGGFFKQIHNVDTEAADALIHPEAHHVVHVRAKGGVFPVEVALLRGKRG